MKLEERSCEPCHRRRTPLTSAEAADLAVQVPRWTVRDGALSRAFKFADFKAAMVFVNRVAEVAETEGHHPDIEIHWNKVRLVLTTHNIGGLSPNDFIVAAKIDGLVDGRP